MTDTIQLLRDMIAIPSVNPMRANSGEPVEREVAAYIETVLNRARIDCERQTIAEGRENVVGIVHPTINGEKRVGLMFNSHMDTVPVDNMTINPFDPLIKNGCVYGRGSCDAKASIAAMLTTAINYANQPQRPFPVVFAAMADEEFSFGGSWKLIEKSWPVSSCVIGEPTQLQRVVAHKGIVRWRIHVEGLSAHGATPELGRNAIYDAARVAIALEKYATRLAGSEPHPLLGKPTFNLGKVSGGHSVNIVPDKCVFEVECRLLPNQKGTDVVNDCARFLRDATDESIKISFEEPYLVDPALETPASAEIVRALGFAQKAAFGSESALEGANYGTDGSKLSTVGIESVVCGPGNIAQAHTSDEYIEMAQVEFATRLYGRLLSSWCGDS